MNLPRRLHAVEKVLGHLSACRTCRGRGGGPRIVLWRKDRPRPVVPGCRECGRQEPRRVKFVILEGESPVIDHYAFRGAPA